LLFFFIVLIVLRLLVVTNYDNELFVARGEVGILGRGAAYGGGSDVGSFSKRSGAVDSV
jgi:hypothetical protein